jgi:predicted RecB family nuclease
MDLKAGAHQEGLSFRAYCYNAGAENQFLRRLGLWAGLEQEIASFIASDEWVDLLEVWNRQLITGTGSGLKVVAPLVGYEWDVDEAGGTESMVWYDLAAAGDNAAQTWLLTYNAGDVGATRALRDWMGATPVPSVASLAARFGVRT